MSFLNKFKFHYHVKHINNLIEEEKHQEFFDYLIGISKDEKLFYEISLKYASNSINQFNQDVTYKKIVWINSFLSEDNEYLKSFINYYLRNFNSLKQGINTYKFEIDQLVINNENIDFNTLVNQSYFFQWMILNKSNVHFFRQKTILILQNKI